MATYYVSSTGGTGTGTTPATAWSLDHALDTANSGLAAGDIIYVMNDGVYALTASTDLAVAEGIIWVGSNSSGIIDGSRPVLRATSSITGAMASLSSSENNALILLDFDANSNADVACDFQPYGCWAVSCVFRSAVDDGTTTGSFIDSVAFDYCLFRDNGRHGAAAEENDTFYKCVFRDNTQDGLSSPSNTVARSCFAAGNGRTGFLRCKTIDCSADNNLGTLYGNFRDGIAVNGLSVRGARSYRLSDTLFCAESSGPAAPNVGSDGTNFTTLVDAGSTPFRDGTSTPPDLRIPTGSALAEAGIHVAESLLGSSITRSSIGIGDYEQESGGGGGSSGSPLGSPFIRV